MRTPFTYDFLTEWLADAGCRRGLATLDNRERETLFVEAVKLDGRPARGDRRISMTACSRAAG